MDMEKLFESASLDGIADNVFGVVNNSVSEVKEMQRKKVAENVQLVVDALKKIESNISSRYDLIGNTLEKRILTIKDGRDGIHGRDGRNGKDGKNGRDGLPGPRGADGKPGRDGADGSDGVSVTDAKIDFDGSLIISLSSGREINVGEVVAPALAEQIKVITNGGGTSQSVIDTLASLQAQITALSGAVIYKGLWNASTNTPTLTSSVGTSGNFYIVSVAGSTSLDGITNWGVGDWAIFNGTAWQRVEGGAAGNFTTVTASGTISAGDTLSMSKASVGAQGGQVANTSTATNAWASWRVSNGARALHLTTTSTGWSGTHLTGGPTSEQSAIYTDGAIPLVFGVSNTMVGQFTSTGLNSTAIGATTPSTGAFTTLSATGVISGTNNAAKQAVFSGYSEFDAAAGTDLATIWLGSQTAHGVLQYTTAGHVFIDNTYNSTSGHIKLRVKTGGTPVTVLDVADTGLAVTGTLSATGNATFSYNAATFGNDATAADVYTYHRHNNYYAYDNYYKGGVQYASELHSSNGGTISYAAGFGWQDYSTSTQLLSFQKDYSVALQGATVKSGTGITFPATQSASSDANTLDDYEEGTWTPADASGAGLTFTSVTAKYTKIGNMVYFNATLTYPTTADVSQAKISGLIFPAANVGQILIVNPGVSVGAGQGWIPNASTTLTIVSQSNALKTNANFSGLTIYLTGSYPV